MLKVLKEVLFTIFIFLVIPLLAFLLITSRSSVILGIRSFVVLTGSMEPKLPVGSVVFTMPAGGYQKGDIITFNRGDITITHRIAGIKNGQFQTKGDANKEADPELVASGDIIGKDFFIVPMLGKLTGFLKTVPGFLIFIALPTLIFIGFEFKNIKDEYKKEVEKKLLEKLQIQ